MVAWLCWLASVGLATADDLGSLCADRAAIERVYYEHRLGNKPPFEQLLPPSVIEQLVKQDLHKEAALKRIYSVDISANQVEAEVKRIDTTTRAPETLAELKKALGDDPARFARSVAKPIVVERELRARFDNDDQLHAPQRRVAEKIRARILAARTNSASFDQLLSLLKEAGAGIVTEVTWQLAPRESDQVASAAPSANGRAAPVSVSPAVSQVKARGGPYSVEATAQIAQVLSPPSQPSMARPFHFEDLPGDLQKVLGTQLQKPADVSAVIETPGSFLLFLAKERTAASLSAASLTIPKRSYEQWVAEQSK
jgi:23S rRNA U2552 (ribose-2'-O)-methylase RlmE/FtsJ